MAETKALQDFLSSRRTKDPKIATHNGVCNWGGKYLVGEYDRVELCKLIADCTLSGKPPSLVANTLAPDGHSEVKVDIDIKQSDGKGRQFNDSHEISLVQLLGDAISKCVNLPDCHSPEIYVNKRKDVYRSKDKDGNWYEKDGIHIMVPNVRVTKDTGLAIRDHLLSGISERFLNAPGLTEISTLNDKPKVVDKCISGGSNGFYTIGSTKPPENGVTIPPYEVLNCYLTDTTGNLAKTELVTNNVSDLAKHIYLVSHDSCKEEHRFEGKILPAKPRVTTGVRRKPKETVAKTKYELPVEIVREASEAILSLSENASDNRDTWLEVCGHAKNISEILKADWIKYSERSSKFKGDEDIKTWDNTVIFDCDRWQSFSAIMRIRDDDRTSEEALIDPSHADGIIRGDLGLTPAKIAMAIHSLLGDKHVCTTGDMTGWRVCKNGLWEPDKNGACIRSKISDTSDGGIVSVLSSYWASLPDTINRRPNMRKRKVKSVIIGLMGGYFKNNVMKECVTDIMNDTSFEERLDSNEDLIAIRGGVLDLKNCKVRPITPKDMISKVMCSKHDLPRSHIDIVNLTSNSPVVTEIFEFLKQIIPNKPTLMYVLKSLGSAMRAGNPYHQMLVFIGDGANGKSVLCNLIREAMGSGLCETTRSTIFTGKRADASGANSCLAKLGKCRVLIINEVPGCKALDSEMIKSLIGGDSISTRGNYKDETVIKPVFVAIMVCNNLPPIRDQSDGIWRRVRVVDFPRRFVSRAIDPETDGDEVFPLDPNLPNKIPIWAPYFLEILIEAYKLQWKEGGIVVPEEVAISTKEYRDENSVYKSFVTNCMKREKGATKLRITTVYEKFKPWFREQNEHGICPKLQTFTIKLVQELGRGEYKKNTGINGWVLIGEEFGSI